MFFQFYHFLFTSLLSQMSPSSTHALSISSFPIHFTSASSFFSFFFFFFCFLNSFLSNFFFSQFRIMEEFFLDDFCEAIKILINFYRKFVFGREVGPMAALAWKECFFAIWLILENNSYVFKLGN